MAQSSTQDRPSLTFTRHYAVAPEKVWQAWTDVRALSCWFGPGAANSVTRAELDLRAGGRYAIAFRTSDGEEHAVSGEYQEVVPHRRLSFTWAWQSTPHRVSLVTIILTPSGAGTDLSLRHDRFFDQQAADNHRRGWSGTLAKLDGFLAA